MKSLDKKILRMYEKETARAISEKLDIPLYKINNIITRLRKEREPDYYTDVVRLCPKCQCEVKHVNKQNKDIAVKNARICRTCNAENYKTIFSGEGNPFYGKTHTEETRKIISTANTGRKISEKQKRQNSIFHKKRHKLKKQKPFYDVWVDKYGVEIAQEKIKNHKKRLSERYSGENNPMFGKPAPNGSGNGWKSHYKGIFFHSLRELCFYIEATEKNELKCERINLLKKYRVSYKDKNNISRTYTADFIINDDTIVEIKPVKLQNTICNLEKFKAMEKFCSENNLKFKIIDQAIDINILIPKFLSGELVFIGKSNEKFSNRIKLIK